MPASATERRSVAVGRAVFRSPLLLGGQAARAGLSCASCHRNGRSNAHFHFPGLSGAPGTADVTASLMSKKRGDGTFNPKPIPDLARRPQDLKVKGTPKLRSFIRGLIVEEFDGPEPSEAVLDGLVAYVNALDPKACRTEANVVSLQMMLKDIDAAVRASEGAYLAKDSATGSALIAAARSMLGAIDERLQVAGLERERAVLQDASRELFAIQGGNGGSFKAWSERWPRRETILRAAEPRSLYSEAVLRERLSVEVRPQPALGAIDRH